eukprot:TRINITY_DN8098_c0_g1_i1.p1 TRINITY_DN8098_c0_g1~~TRINITY_DN8098_c0_g1_i1.p1  ORF type:complete len:703 (+),score=153.41 TRINITY_DN8098_c0_g1_i1:241-2109(+)
MTKSPQAAEDEDFMLAWQLQEHETQAARIRAQQHQRQSMSPNNKYEKVASHYDTTALDLYYQSDRQFGNDGEEDEEDDYIDEDQRELQKRGIKVAGMKPSHAVVKTQGRQSAGKYHKAKQTSSPQPIITPAQPKTPSTPSNSPARTPTKVAPVPPAKEPIVSSPFETPLDVEDDSPDEEEDDSVPAGPRTPLKGGGGNATRKEKREEKLETLNPTSSAVLDGRTRLKLQKIVNEGLIDTIGGVVAVGKEASVFHADKDAGSKEYAVKIFKTTLSEFREREQYLLGEWRFRHETTKQLSTHKLIKLWAEKEIRNLKRLRSCDVAVPEPIALKGHIVIMDFLGAKSRPAPQLAKLKFLDLSPADASRRWEDIYMQVLTTMRLMYQKAKLVHADLSEWNLLYFKDLVYLIDTAQAVESEHPNALLFLRRDCHNMATFFRRRGVKNGLTTRQIFGFVTETSAALGQDFDANQWDSYIVQLRKENSGKTQQELSNEDQVAEAVFMNSFIPRTLRQVPNPLEEIEQMQAGADVSALLHATVTGVGIDGFFKPDGSYAMKDGEKDDEDEESDEESAEESKSGSDDEGLSSTSTKKNEIRPRKSLTKEERKQQRREVKAKRREARQNRNK